MTDLFAKLIKENTTDIYDVPILNPRAYGEAIVRHIIGKMEYEAETNATNPEEFYGLALEILDEFEMDE
jgi:hypothetical protein